MSRFRGIAIAAVAALCLPGGARAVELAYPSKPIRLIVPFAPGGGNDIIARIVAQKLAESWSQQVVVDNRGGAGGNIAAEMAARAPADGYTLFLLNSANLIAPSLYRRLAYDPLRDFAPVTQMVGSPFLIVVSADSLLRTFGDLLAQARARPGTITYASGGNGSSTHLASELFAQQADIKLVHIPYKGAGPAFIDLLGGQVTLYWSSVLPAIPYLNSGRIRVLAVTGLHRLKMLPEMPTAQESGLKNYESSVTYGIAVPAATPAAIVRKLQEAIDRVLNLPDIRARLEGQGLEVVASTSAEYAQVINAEVAKWAQIVKVSGAKVD